MSLEGIIRATKFAATGRCGAKLPASFLQAEKKILYTFLRGIEAIITCENTQNERKSHVGES